MKKFSICLTLLLLVGGLNAQETKRYHGAIGGENSNSSKPAPRYQGVVLEVLDAKAYTYLKINETLQGDDSTKLKSFWIAVENSAVKVGDYVRFKKELVTKNFKSKTLNRTFDEVMFASQLEYKVSK